MPDTDHVVSGRGAIQSPVLVGRDDFVALGERRLAEAAGGRGQLLFIAGEAGIGKTRLLSAVAAHAASEFTVVRAAAFPGDLQSFAGLLIDLTSDLTDRTEPALREAGRRMLDRIRESADSGGDAHYRRRLLVQDVVDALVTLAGPTPLLIILEDLHWADGFSVDVLGRLAGRIAGRPMLIAGAYRSDELFAESPLRELRSRLLSQRLAEEIRLPRLGIAEVAAMTAAVYGRPATAPFVAAVHRRSDGIPLHVEELLATIDVDGTAPEPVASALVPDTVGDAIRARARGLATRARDVAAAAAVIGRSFDFDLLTAVAGLEPASVAAALTELQAAYLILPSRSSPGAAMFGTALSGAAVAGADPAATTGILGTGQDAVTGRSFDFRHAFIRDTFYADTDLATRRRLHERVAVDATAHGYRGAFVSAHFEQAGLTASAYPHAVGAAREAAAMSSHREALDLYQRAVRCAPADLARRDRAALYAAFADEAAAADENTAAAAAYRRAHELTTADGDVRRAAALVPRLVAVDHLLGAALDARVARLQAALDGLDGMTGADRDRAALRSAMAAAYMLDRRLDDALHHGEAILHGAGHDDAVALNTAATHGSVLVFAGRMDEGWQLLEGSIARAVNTHQEAEAARGFRMIGSSASVLVEYDRAEAWLDRGITYTEQVELANHRHYMVAHLAHVRWATGDWESARTLAEHARDDGRGGITTRITAQYVLGYLALGRGEWDSANALLHDAYAQGESMAELQRLSPALWGLAEVARCRGDHDAALALCERGYDASARVGDAAYLFPFLVTGVRAHLGRDDVNGAQSWLDKVANLLTARGIPGTIPAVDHGHALVLGARGNVPAASAALDAADLGWRQRRRFWEGSWLQIDRAAMALRSRRRAEASALLATVRRTASGSAALLAGADRCEAPRAIEPWHPLSAREFEVARLVAEGLTNREIAARLTLAPKTVSAHVEHILTKLGAGRRTEIAAWSTAIKERPPSA